MVGGLCAHLTLSAGKRNKMHGGVGRGRRVGFLGGCGGGVASPGDG